MIKECPVIMSNSLITVVRYDGNDIQLSYNAVGKKSLKVKCKNGVYSIVDEKNNKYDRESSNEHNFNSVTTFEDKKKTIINEETNKSDE